MQKNYTSPSEITLNKRPGAASHKIHWETSTNMVLEMPSMKYGKVFNVPWKYELVSQDCRLDVKSPWKTPTFTRVPCILGNSHNNLCPMSGKECWFHLLYDLGDGGLVIKNVCAYFQNWYHDGLSATICWVPTRWWRWILSLEGFKGWEPRSIYSSPGLCLFSDWNWVAEVRQTYKLGNRLARGCIYPQGITNKNFNHHTTCHKIIIYLYGIKYDTGI